MSVLMETTFGDITIDLYVKERPRACLNFLKLCKVKYYNYCAFFNVQRDFIAQTGDPTDTGKGGESIFGKLYGDQAAFFEPEIVPPMKHCKVGTVSMANNGNMLGSQFFITLAENLDYLDDVHTVFGEVVEGFDILRKINEAIVDNTRRPYQDIRINHTVILDDPFEDPTNLEIPKRSPSPTPIQLESGRIAPDEAIEENNGLSKEEFEEKLLEKEAKARAQILEMVGDLPDADVKPPDNVLFVCKLNPVTTDEDLMIIFSRFGPIKKCEVIRDQRSGESLQYAFVEFEDDEHCANAYFKMDNVLIDDRRIHVDFSQSVSKLDWVQKRGRQPEKNDVTRNGNSKRYQDRESYASRSDHRNPDRRRERSPARRRPSPYSKARRSRTPRSRQRTFQSKSKPHRQSSSSSSSSPANKNRDKKREQSKRKERRRSDSSLEERRKKRPQRTPSPVARQNRKSRRSRSLSREHRARR